MFFASVVENIPQTIFIKETKDLRYIYLNRASADLLGRSREELVGKTDYDIFPREVAEVFRSQGREMLRSGALPDFPKETVSTPHMGERIVHTRKIPLMSASGEPDYLVGVAEDVTDRKRADEALRESEERFRNAFDNVPVGMALVGLDGRSSRTKATAS